jgi:hypothetical protein
MQYFHLYPLSMDDYVYPHDGAFEIPASWVRLSTLKLQVSPALSKTCCSAEPPALDVSVIGLHYQGIAEDLVAICCSATGRLTIKLGQSGCATQTMLYMQMEGFFRVRLPVLPMLQVLQIESTGMVDVLHHKGSTARNVEAFVSPLVSLIFVHRGSHQFSAGVQVRRPLSSRRLARQQNTPSTFYHYLCPNLTGTPLTDLHSCLSSSLYLLDELNCNLP